MQAMFSGVISSITSSVSSLLIDLAPRTSPAASSPTPLSETDQKLCNLVIQKLSFFFERQTVIETPVVISKPKEAPFREAAETAPRECALIFHQTKSWIPVENMLSRIVSSDEKIREWVRKWQERITLLRNAQKCIREKEEELRKIDQFLPATTIAETREVLKKTIEEAGVRIKELVEQGLEAIPDPASQVSFGSCEEVINFLSTHWAQLTVFSEWPSEVSLDEETIIPKIGHKLNSSGSSFSLKQFSRIKAIFQIRESQQGETSVIRERSDGNIVKGKILKTIRVITIGTPLLAPASPHLPAAQLSDEVLFGFSFTGRDGGSPQPVEQSVGLTARKLVKVVDHALEKLNMRLSTNNTRTAKVIPPMRTLIESSPLRMPLTLPKQDMPPRRDAGNDESKEASEA